MSWSVTAEGTRDEVNKKIANEASVPVAVVGAIGMVMAEYAPDVPLTVTTNGHHDGAGGGNATITVKTN
jgi:hypothetical protein